MDLFEPLGERILQTVAVPFRRRPETWLVAFGAFGGLPSLLVIATHVVPDGAARIANLAVTPLLAGGCMVLFEPWRARRGDEVRRIDRFFHGSLFAQAFALVRYALAGRTDVPRARSRSPGTSAWAAASMATPCRHKRCRCTPSNRAPARSAVRRLARLPVAARISRRARPRRPKPNPATRVAMRAAIARPRADSRVQ